MYATPVLLHGKGTLNLVHPNHEDNLGHNGMHVQIK